jgi:thymidylate kinase
MGVDMIVEFIGVPGAGKTTLMPVVSAHFKEQHFQAYTVLGAARPFAARSLLGKIVCLMTHGKLERFLLWQVFYTLSYIYRLSFYRQNPILMQSVQDFQKGRPISKTDQEHVMRWFLHQTGTYQFLKAYGRTGDMLIFDEGFIHRVVQLFASENETPDLDRVAAYLDLIPKPDLIIFPRVSSEVGERRVYERGLWERFKVKSHKETSRYFKNAHSIVSFAVEHVKVKGWTVIEVDNNKENLPTTKSVLRRDLSDLLVHFPEKAYLSG